MRSQSTRRVFLGWAVSTGALAALVPAAWAQKDRDTLSEPHLTIFRKQYGDLVSRLGYEVR